jgi:hypothetical protein
MNFDPEKVQRWTATAPVSECGTNLVVLASDYDQLLALYREMVEAREDIEIVRAYING